MVAHTPSGGEERAVLSDSFRRFADSVPLMMWRSDEAGHAIWRRLQLTNDETRAAARPTPDGARSSTRTRH